MRTAGTQYRRTHRQFRKICGIVSGRIGRDIQVVAQDHCNPVGAVFTHRRYMGSQFAQNRNGQMVFAGQFQQLLLQIGTQFLDAQHFAHAFQRF